jgi:hypothetical protein
MLTALFTATIIAASPKATGVSLASDPAVASTSASAEAQAPPDSIDETPSERAARGQRELEEQRRAASVLREQERIGLSAALCAYQSNREKSLAGIKEERALAKLGGVLNLSKVYAYQDHVRQQDTAIQGVRDRLKSQRMTAAKCAHDIVRRLAPCLEITWQSGYLDDPFTYVSTPRLTTEWRNDGECDDAELDPYKID